MTNARPQLTNNTKGENMATITKTKPRTLADFPGYVAAKTKLADLQSQHAELKARIDALPVGESARASQSIGQKAADLVAGRQADPTQLTATELSEQAAVLDRAVKLAENALAAEQREASAAVCTDHLPRRQRLIEVVVDKVVALGEAYRLIGVQDDELRQAGVSSNLPTVQFAAWPLLGRALHLLAGPGGENLLRKLHRDNSTRGKI